MAFLQSGQGREPFLRAPIPCAVADRGLVAAHVARMLMTTAASERILVEYAFIPASLFAATRSSPAARLIAPCRSSAICFCTPISPISRSIACGCSRSVRSLRAASAAGSFLLFFLICGVAAAAIHLAFNWESPGCGYRRVRRDLRSDGGRYPHVARAALRGAVARPRPCADPVSAGAGFFAALGRDQSRLRLDRPGWSVGKSSRLPGRPILEGISRGCCWPALSTCGHVPGDGDPPAAA